MKNISLFLAFLFFAALGSVVFYSGCTGSKAGTQSVAHTAVWSDGTWIRDTQGRVIIVHGMNVNDPAKHPPYLPFTDTVITGDALRQNLDQNFARLRGLGLNAVRLIVVWAALEPTPGVIDTGYIDRVQEEVQACKDSGLWVLIDMHQDLYSESFCGGDGAPAWACALSGYSPTACSSTWAANYGLPQVMQSFQNLWDDSAAPDGTGLQEHYAAVFRAVAQRFSGTSNVLGYEIINEPFPGNAYPLTSPDFETKELVPFYEKITRAIRAVDPYHIVAFEPSVVLTNLLNSYRTAISGTTFPGEFPGLMFVPHFYPLSINPSYGTDTSIIVPSFAQIRDDGTAMKVPCVVDETGTGYSSPGSANYMVALLNGFDLYSAGWFDWDYNIVNDDNMSPYYPDGTPRPLVDQNGDPVFNGIDVLSRPYPMLTAGTPVSISYPITSDPAGFSTTTFTYTYREDGIARGDTEIFLPQVHFPDGFTVTTTDGSVSFDPATDVLSYTKGRLPLHTIAVIPCSPGATGCIPF
ncbi:MAG: cellulase family glycosylhydrolase [Deltaproteobacteria bacterium]|nr:cellulase family glycosylhydrolase [Deltaproteobacteria bacterium]